MRYLVTGAAGFIGFHVARRLLTDGHFVFGVDGFTPYYEVSLKRRRNHLLTAYDQFIGREVLLEDVAGVASCVAEASADVVIHLAAQAGVRYSAENPKSYIDSNIIGSFNLIEALKRQPCKHLVLASTSSVYGDSGGKPCNEQRPTDRPLSLYAATKVAVEALGFSHAHNCGQPTTTIRPFTVYGPWGRPDMAIFKFTKNILAQVPIDVHGFGRMQRDFTYIDDVVESIVRLAGLAPASGMSEPGRAPGTPYRVVNIGRGEPIELEDFISAIEAEVGKTAVRRDLPVQPGEVTSTQADVTLLEQLIGFRPRTSLERGIHEFVAWYREYYRS